MKLLLDQHLSRRIVPFLQEVFPGSSQLALLGKERAPDREVWELARSGNYVLVTQDADFADLSAVFGAPPTVVWLRTGNLGRSQCLKLLLDRRSAIETAVSETKALVEIYS